MIRAFGRVVSLLLVLSVVSLALSPLVPSSRRVHLTSTVSLCAATDDDTDGERERLSDEELEATMGEWDERIPQYNTVHLTGRIGSDPEPRYLDNGKVVVNVNLATKRKYHSYERQTKNIKWGEEETDWYGLEIWGATAEFVGKYVDKGARVGVIGSLQVDEWTDRETGEPRSRPKIIVRDIDILETRAEAESRRSRGGRGGGQSSFYGSSKGGGDDDDDWPSPAGSGNFF